MISLFHAHIYFAADTWESAEALRIKIGKQFGPKLRHWGALINRPVGPHPVPMFEINFTSTHFSEIVIFLMLNHGTHAVLIHPETGNDLTDHTTHALWLGKPLTLDLRAL